MDRREFPKLPEDLRAWPHAKLVLELNEVVQRACAKIPAERYPTCQEMHDELAVLERGQSVQRQRTVQSYWAAGKKAGIAVGVIAAVVALVSFWPRSQPLQPQASSDGPDSPITEANGYCNSGMNILRGDNYAEFPEAYTNFHKAIELDPNFARPYVGLLEMMVRENVPGIPDIKAEVIVERLQKLAPGLAATCVARGVISYGECRFDEAERCLQKAVKADPNYELGQTFYVWLLVCYGRKANAWRQVEICRRLAPSKAITGFQTVAECYYLERDYPKAIAWYRKELQRTPRDTFCSDMLSQCYEALGDYTKAIEYRQQAYVLATGADEAEATKGSDILRDHLAREGIHGYWQQQWRATEADTNAGAYWKARVQIRLGNPDQAIYWLQQSWKKNESDRVPMVSRLLFDDFWDGLHGDPRFQRLLDEVGLAKVMRPEQNYKRPSLE
jgi:tetratricopeptide (TPR) repeat protein